MKVAKAKLIEPLSRHIHHKIISLKPENTRGFIDEANDISQLQKTMENIKNAPEWPYNVSILRRFFITYLPPTLTAIVIEAIRIGLFE